MIHSTCFGHIYAHHQELETICVLLPSMVCSAWLLVVAVQVQGCRLCVQEEVCCTPESCNIPLPGHPSSWTSLPAIKHSVTSSWFFFSTNKILFILKYKHNKKCNITFNNGRSYSFVFQYLQANERVKVLVPHAGHERIREWRCNSTHI